MNGVEVLKNSMGLSLQITVQLAEDLRDHSLERPCKGGNHALWIMGHLAYSNAQFDQMIVGGSNQLAHWEKLFKGGSTPSDDASIYPAYDETIEQFKQQHSQLITKLESLTDTDLDAAPAAPLKGLEEFFGSIGNCLLVASIHPWHHRGQLADIRKVLERPPMMG